MESITRIGTSQTFSRTHQRSDMWTTDSIREYEAYLEAECEIWQCQESFFFDRSWCQIEPYTTSLHTSASIIRTDSCISAVVSSTGMMIVFVPQTNPSNVSWMVFCHSVFLNRDGGLDVRWESDIGCFQWNELAASHLETVFNVRYYN